MIIVLLFFLLVASDIMRGKEFAWPILIVIYSGNRVAHHIILEYLKIFVYIRTECKVLSKLLACLCYKLQSNDGM